MAKHVQIKENRETIEEPCVNEDASRWPGDFVSYYLEYELDLEWGGHILINLEESSYLVLIIN